MLLICMVTVSLCAALTFVPFHGVTQAHADSFTQVWGDEFNGAAGTGVDTSNWLYDTGTGYGCSGCPGNWGTGEVESMTNSTSNVYQDGNGHLVITAQRDGSGNWTSGRIETQNTSFAAPPGGELEVTASIEQPNVSGSAAAGYWPAFWMLGSAFRGNYLNWPGIGEIDIMEDINGLSSEFGTLHCGTSPGGPCNETTGLGSGQQPCSGCQSGFHTYSVIVDRSVSPEQIRWYLDGNNFFTVNANQVDSTTWANAVDHSFFVIFDLAMGGGFPAAFGGGPTSATQPGASMLVDYVRVYTSNGGASTPTATPTAPPTSTPTNSIYSNLPGTWNQCAGENGTCNFSGTMSVAYGANGQYSYGTFSNGTDCNNSVFGDPASGYAKTCYVEPAPSDSNVWTQCSSENGTCSFSDTMLVAYGANGKFNYQTLTNGTACNNSVFGDPDYGYAKACYITAAPVLNSTWWNECSSENGTCGFYGTKEVAYGANGQYYYQQVTNGTACNNSVFGDPDYGYAKACYENIS
jgi:hypothetical protein